MKYCVWTFFYILALPLFGQNGNELNQQSKELIQQNKFDEALPLLKKAAALGNAEAQYNFGVFLKKTITKAIYGFSFTMNTKKILVF